jgi:hypothetical protein
MSYGEDDNGQSYMFPTIFNDKNEAVKVPNQYADYISNVGYKNATGIPTYMYGGIQKYQEGGIEESINKRLGDPMNKAEIDSDYKRPTVDPRTRRQHEAEPVDNVRHAAAGRYTQEAIENYANLIPYASAIPGFSKAAGFIGSNVLGLGHEASTLLNKNDDDTRTMGMKVKESAADAYNNMIGSVIGASNLTPYQKKAYIKYLSETGKIPTGQYNKKKDPTYKKEMGGIQRFDEGGKYKSQEDYQSHLLDPYSKEKKQAQIQWLTSQAQATASLNDIKNRRKLKDYDIPENTPQNVRQFAEISPTGYTDMGNYTRYLMGTSRWDMDKPQTTMADEEAWMKYNNIPHKNKYIIPSKYKPSTSKNPNTIYNKFDDTTDSLMFNDIENRLRYEPYGNIQVGEIEMSSKPGFNMYSPMGNFTIGKGKDEKGEYVSYYDKYDFDSAPGFVQSRLPGNEFEFYNRRYLKPKLSAWDQKGEELEQARQKLKGKQNKTNK